MASVQHRRNRYYVRWRDGGRGSREQVRVFKTEAEALVFKAQRDREATTRRVLAGVPGIPGWDDERIVEADDPFTAYARRMIELDDSLRPGTKAVYLRNLRLHFEGAALGATDIRTIGPEDVETFWRSLPDTEAKGVRRQVYLLLAKVLNAAVKVGDIPVSPLARSHVQRPTSSRPEIEPLSVDELERLAEAAAASQWDEYESARNRLEILVMGYSGVRGGELGAIRRQDVVRDDEGRCSIRVSRQVVRITGSDARIADVKSSAGRRTIYIPCSLAGDIAAFIERFGTARDGRLFHGRRDALRYAHLVNHSVSSAGRKIGMDVNAHQLRHTAASLLRRSGADIRALQRFMGHADIRVTLGTYSHLYGDELGDLADRMEALREEHRNGTG